jgi:phenylalanyl-tRNA synthetase beta chain
MPTVTLNRKEFEKLVGKKLSDEKLKDRISYLGTALEGLTADEIHVEIFPNRPDMLSEQGLARAFASFIGAKPGLKEYKIHKSNEKVIVESSVKDVRPFTAVAIVKGLKFDDEKIKEVIQIQEKLHVTYGRNRKKVAIGIYPYEKIKTPIRFIALPPEEIKFRPLEYPHEIDGRQILSKHPTGREYGHLLEGKEKYPIFIDANDQILSMPPIINSHNVGKVSYETTDVFIECSGFDYDVLSKCLNMIVTALADMGGEIYSMELDLYGKKLTSPDLSPKEMHIDLDYVNKILGLEITQKELKELLEKMGHGFSKGKVLTPAYRADILHQIDLVEDIGIAYGYENIPEEIPRVATIGRENKHEVFKRKISEMLAMLGLLECKTYHLTNKINQTKLMNTETDVVELANALNEEYNVLAGWITPQMLETLKMNKQHEYPQNIFLISGTFQKDQNYETGVRESDNLGVSLCSDEADFTRVKQVLDYLMRMISVEYSIEPSDHISYIPGRSGKIIVNGKNIGTIGEISPEILSNWSLDMPVSSFEIDLKEFA